MSFGRSLRLFFIGIVVVPMVVLAVLVLQVNGDSRNGKADARLAAGLDTARAVYDEALRAAPGEARRIARQVGPDLDAPNRGALAAAASAARQDADVVAVTIVDGGGVTLGSTGPRNAIATGESSVRSSAGNELLGTVRVAMLDPDDFVAQVHTLTSSDVAVVAESGVIAGTREFGDVSLPEEAGSGSVNVSLPEAGASRAAALRLNGAPPGARLVLFTPLESGFVASEPVVAAALIVFFAIAFFLMLLLLRQLQRRIAAMLAAAQRIGEGDFDHDLPVEGDDEMAGLALALNRMSNRLSDQMSELKHQREELDRSVKRIGNAFASGLDRRALLEIVAETAVSATDAEGGRVVLLADREVLQTQRAPAHLEAVLEEAGTSAWEARGEGAASAGDCHAIAHAMTDSGESRDVFSTLAVGRKGEPFSPNEREVLSYLIVQTTTSIENIELHERVSEQAFTDGLTGIPNYRRFNEWLEREVGRIDRFGGELSLVLLDIDGFKTVNDTYGHLTGDRVLESIGRVLADELRDVDLAARYGGEEFVMALPETPRDGAVEVAERVRTSIERSRVGAEGSELEVAVTASFGIGTLPADGADAPSLIAAADRALYQAKRAGKNQVVAGTAEGRSPPQGNGSGRRT
ncbi:MAG: diguanylate cyclase [Solirubrobacterales bacterium]